MLISPVSLSCVTLLSQSPVLRLLSHVSFLLSVSCFMSYSLLLSFLGLLAHISCLTFPLSCHTSPVSCLTSPFTCLLSHIFCFLPSVADPDPDPDLWNLYHFPGSRSGSVSIIGWIQNPDLDLYQMIRIRIQQKSLKTENNLKYF